MRNLEKGPQMGESTFQDDQVSTDVEWAKFDTIFDYKMLVGII